MHGIYFPVSFRQPRKKLLEEKSDATIVAPGGIGTYEEFFEIFTLKSLKRIDRQVLRS